MKKLSLLIIILLTVANTIFAQQELLQSGPMLGYSEMREVQLWVQTKAVAEVQITYWQKDVTPIDTFYTEKVTTEKRTAFTAKLLADEILPGRSYVYQLLINNKVISFDYDLAFESQPLWQWRRDAPNFKFALGSCTYISEERFDRPGKPYGSEYGIFETIADKEPDMMLWLGDNMYLREADWNTRTGIFHRYTHTRSIPQMQRLLATCHHFAIWDDHDFGPNNSDRSFIHQDKTREAFELFWTNPTFGVPNAEKSVASQFQFHDIEFFLLDNRTFKTRDDLKDGEKMILGKEQLEWLIESMKNSFSPFKMVAIGGQVLNSEAVAENYANYAKEKAYLLKRIEEEKIKGVIFVTGDRHFTELSRVESENGFIMYDLTVSALTSGMNTRAEKEKNKNRVEGTVVMEHNFAVIEVTGKRKERVLNITVYNTTGEALWTRKIDSAEFWKKK